jgi:hypothetical protein
MNLKGKEEEEDLFKIKNQVDNRVRVDLLMAPSPVP